MALYHAYTQTVGDGTATSLVRPSDWNSGHIQNMTFGGNTAGQSTASGTNIIFAGGNNITLNVAQGAGVATVSISAAAQTVDINKAGTGFTTTTAAGVAWSGTNDTNGLKFAMPAYLTTGMLSNAGSNFAPVSTVTAGANAFNVSGTFASDGITLSAAAPGDVYTALSLQNRQLGASTTLNSMGGQNSLWLAPVRVAVPVSASTFLGAIMSYSGTITSAATAQMGHTILGAIWTQYTDPASTTRFGTWWTGAMSMTFWNSGTSSNSYRISNSANVTTSSSAGSNLLTASIMGVRLLLMPIGSTLPAGLCIFGVLNSTSSAGYTAHMSRVAMVMDNPLSIGMGTMGQSTNNSVGYVDGGTYLTTTGALPATIALSQIGAVANQMPYFKVGAI